jgi:hypothetical protein
MFVLMQQAISPTPLREDLLFHADQNINSYVLGTLDSSRSQVSTRNTISISLGIKRNIGPFSREIPDSSKKGFKVSQIAIYCYLFGLYVGNTEGGGGQGVNQYYLFKQLAVTLLFY